MNRWCDLHTHTFYSDGTLSPEQLVQEAKNAGLSAIAVTDHDITDGIEPAETEGRRIGLEIIPGIEITATARNAQGAEIDMHILAYFIRHQDNSFQKILTDLRERRARRMEQILEKLERLGLKLNTQFLREQAGKKAVGRTHVARALVEAGYSTSVDEAFRRYLQAGCAAYVPQNSLTPVECINLVRQAGGVSVVAHPRFGGPRDRKGWEDLARAGLDGIEAYHSQHSSSAAKSYHRLAQELGLLVTGGSDFHSFQNRGKEKLGESLLPYEMVDSLRARKQALGSFV
jgi:predicted metal-dependent phosphoesterase TrpH